MHTVHPTHPAHLMTTHTTSSNMHTSSAMPLGCVMRFTTFDPRMMSAMEEKEEEEEEEGMKKEGTEERMSVVSTCGV